MNESYLTDNSGKLIDKEQIETIVDKSGISLWQKPKRVISFLQRPKVLPIGIILLLFFGLILSSGLIIQRNSIVSLEDKIEAKDKKLASTSRELKDSQDSLNKANEKIQVCQSSVETAWRAFDRRNALIVAVLNDLFSEDTERINNDNLLEAADFVATKDCNEAMDSDKIFLSQN